MSAGGTSFYVIGGTLRPDAPSYVDRQADRDLFEGLLNGEFCYVLTARQMGKSSLMVRTANKLRERGVHVIALDLSAIGQNLTPDQWYSGLLTSMGDQLGLEDELEEFWVANQSLGPVQRWFTSIRKALLVWRGGPMVIFLDEIDTVRSLPFSTDEFFAAIRECYNRRSEDPEFKRLSFCLLGVATPSDLIRDTRITPFNIGKRIELDDFTAEEAAPLVNGLNVDAPRTSRLLRRVLHWTSGHPYLTQRLCQALARDLRANRPGDVDRCCEELFFSNRARQQDDNLIFVRERLLRSESDVTGLLELYLKVRSGKRVVDDESHPLVSILRLSGIVRSERGLLVERNRIYYRVFGHEWVAANLPGAELRRQRAAFLRGVYRTSGIAAVVVAALAVMGVITVRRADTERRALAQSYFSEAQARRVSGLSGQRYESWNALRKARGYHTNLAALRDEAIACLALVDLREITNAIPPIHETNVFELDPNLDVSAQAEVDGRITFRSLQRGQVLKSVSGIGVPVRQFRFSPDGSILLSEYQGESQNQIIVWDWRNGRKLFSIAHGIHRNAIDFTADSGKLAISRGDGHVIVYSLPHGEVLHELELRWESGLPRVPQVLRFNPSGNLLAESCLDDLYVQIWNLDKAQKTRLFHPAGVYDISWHPRGELLATACADFSVYLWNTNRTDREIKKLIGHESAVISVAFNHRGTLIATLGRDETVKLWIPATDRQMTRRLDGESIERLEFSANDSRLIATGGTHTTARMWEFFGDEYVVLQAHATPGDKLRTVDFSPDGRLLAAVSAKGATIWDSDSGLELGVVSLTNAHAALFSADSHHLLASTDDGLFQCSLSYSTGGKRPLLTQGSIQRVEEPLQELKTMAVSLERDTAAIVHKSEILLVPLNSDRSSSVRVISLPTHYHRLALHPQMEWMAAAIAGFNSADIWKLSETDGHRTSFPLPSSEYFTFSPNGKWLANCWAGYFQFYRVGVWTEPAFRIPRTTLSDQHAPIAFTNEGALVALASSRYTIQLVRLPDDKLSQPKPIATFESPDRNPLEILTFSPDGQRLAATTMNLTIHLWNLALLRTGLTDLDLQNDWPEYP